jgi:hypothetical protein
MNPEQEKSPLGAGLHITINGWMGLLEVGKPVESSNGLHKAEVSFKNLEHFLQEIAALSEKYGVQSTVRFIGYYHQ